MYKSEAIDIYIYIYISIYSEARQGRKGFKNRIE
jgi:hypothetical protein